MSETHNIPFYVINNSERYALIRTLKLLSDIDQEIKERLISDLEKSTEITDDINKLIEDNPSIRNLFELSERISSEYVNNSDKHIDDLRTYCGIEM